MRAALRAAERGLGHVSPNPIVGAALELRDGTIRSAGHLRYGGLHAEARLLSGLPRLPRGSTIHVTLEPCAHLGKQPPCAELLVAARPARVVVAGLDPDPRVRGRGVATLREAGIPVEVGPGERVAAA
jgi:diaminohydroxyphosphoribosylaminopyrimidine deaminase/5-amino-6-(5-phosphoribosylamino)uracil reductase